MSPRRQSRLRLRLQSFFSRSTQAPTGNNPPEETDCSALGKPKASLFPCGIKVLHDCSNAIVDICFIHGLTGDRDTTWTVRGQSLPWPKTLLPAMFEGARILTYGYDAYIVRPSVASRNRLRDHANNLLTDLCNARHDASSRPLIFINHSLGGLVCKQAILLSRIHSERHLRGIFESTKGIIFMGTPHKGSWIANWARIPASALSLVKSTNTSLLGILGTDNEFLEAIQIDFGGMIRNLRENGRSFEVTCFFEELPMLGDVLIVPKESATLENYNSISIHANHSEMVKFHSADDNGYERLLGELMRWRTELVRGRVDEGASEDVSSQLYSPPGFSSGHLQQTYPERRVVKYRNNPSSRSSRILPNRSYTVSDFQRRKGELEWSRILEARYIKRSCLNCGGDGHWQSDCEDECGKCLDSRHIARDCKSSIRCQECGEQHHTSKDCPQRLYY
ncbi:hypothetical protein BJY04DRAFT_120489 [Aspergillus karnatakaensis]|uniref:uncharacterized protein n=1 Tax=Aspergillus karnatakaensis TaxID=1810916 RepID=UPI003CCD2C5B